MVCWSTRANSLDALSHEVLFVYKNFYDTLCLCASEFLTETTKSGIPNCIKT